jgi:SEL1 protein
MYTLEASSSQKYGPPGTYIYKVVPLKDGILSISSDNVLRLINPEALGDQPLVSISPPQSDITSLVILDHDNLIICVGDRQGHLSVFDLKQGAKVATFQTGM